MNIYNRLPYASLLFAIRFKLLCALDSLYNDGRGRPSAIAYSRNTVFAHLQLM
jgi:hypothetical protein